MFTANLGGDANVRTALTDDFVPKVSQRCLQSRAAYVARQSHATRISSRTK